MIYLGYLIYNQYCKFCFLFCHALNQNKEKRHNVLLKSPFQVANTFQGAHLISLEYSHQNHRFHLSLQLAFCKQFSIVIEVRERLLRFQAFFGTTYRVSLSLLCLTNCSFRQESLSLLFQVHSGTVQDTSQFTLGCI